MKIIMLATSELKEGMIVARDIYSKAGTLLIPNKTSLSSNHIIKINVYSVNEIAIYGDDQLKATVIEDPTDKFDLEMKLTDTTQEKVNTFTKSPEFQSFTEKYEQLLAMVETQLNEIIKTDSIDVAHLYDLVVDIITATNTDNLFSFLCRMRSSDNVTYSHSLNVSMLASILGKWLELPVHTITELAIAGLLHDIGKVKVNQDTLNKVGKLTDEEFVHLKKHTTLGYQLVADSSLSLGIKQAVLMHHEKMNGAGYPLGISLDLIHDYAKIISIVDIYDAMTAKRPYHKRYHPFHVMQMIEEECYGVLDSAYLEVFLERIAHNFLDDMVMLSDHNQAKIIFVHHRNPTQPIVELANGERIDLHQEDGLSIIDFL